MADTALQALAKLYQDEKRKLDEKGADFTEYNALAFTHGYPEADEDNAIDHSGYARHMAAGTPAKQHQGAQGASGDAMEQEYISRYGRLPTLAQLQQAAAGMTPDDVATEHGRELLYSRVAKLAGHTEVEAAEQADAFGGSRASGSHHPDDRPVGVEEANREWIGQLQAGRAKMGLR